MIELEIQVLALQREGLLVEVGRLAGLCGYTLVRQRQVQDPHGTLLSMVVRGSWFKKRALQSALATCDRLVSFELYPVEEGQQREHFAASSKAVSNYVPPPAPGSEPLPVDEKGEEVAAIAETAPPEPPARPVVEAPIAAPLESFEAFIVEHRPAPAPAPSEPPSAPFVEVVALEADVAAVDKALASLEYDYPRIVPTLLKLDRAVAEGARESSLQLAGQRVGAWLHARGKVKGGTQPLAAALASVATPALQAFVEIDLQGDQLHIRHSPLCTEQGHSGCSFYGGLLEGLLAPVIAPHVLSIFPVCCRSYGADDCVLAISE